MNTDKFGNLVRSKRKEQKLTQQYLADLAGVSVRFLGDLERGKETCELGKSLRVAAVLGIRIDHGGAV